MNFPKRIISLVPSQTELLADLGLDEEVIGITKFCVHPAHWYRTKTRIGGTKTVNIALVNSLQPDLIIANKEENVKDQVAALEKIAPVWISDINTLDEAMILISDIGVITGRTERASILIRQLQKDFTRLQTFSHQAIFRRYKTAYLIWKDPYMAAGENTFINDILQRCGWENAFTRKRYPEVTIEDLRAQQTELILLSSEPYPFKQKHIRELAEALPGVTILLVDGEMFSWYGSRLLYTTAYIEKLVAELNKG